MKTGIELIAEERKRQVEVEHYGKDHDALHGMAELSSAAVAYILAGQDKEENYFDEFDDKESRKEKELNPVIVNDYWPWSDGSFKPDRVNGNQPSIKDLIKAGALIAAEIDRLQFNETNATN